MICLNDGREDGKAILRVERCIKVVAVDASNLLRDGDVKRCLITQKPAAKTTYDLLSRLRLVNQVPKQDNFPVTR